MTPLASTIPVTPIKIAGTPVARNGPTSIVKVRCSRATPRKKARMPRPRLFIVTMYVALRQKAWHSARANLLHYAWRLQHPRMKALRLHEIGGPHNLRIDEVGVPAIRDDEALVRIRAAALNHRDVYITQGLYPRIRLPVTLGSDGAGEIARLNAVVSDLDVGDEIVIDPMLDWGDDPRVWDAASGTILGMPREGTFAQYVAVPLDNIYRKPATLSIEEAAAIPLAGLTAYRAFSLAAHCSPKRRF